MNSLLAFATTPGDDPDSDLEIATEGGVLAVSTFCHPALALVKGASFNGAGLLLTFFRAPPVGGRTNVEENLADLGVRGVRGVGGKADGGCED